MSQETHRAPNSILEELAVLAAEGLLTDGGHHKQWYLERILHVILGAEGFAELYATWERDGVAPPRGIAP